MSKRPVFDATNKRNKEKQPLTGVNAFEVVFTRENKEFSRGILFLDRARFQFSRKVAQVSAEYLASSIFNFGPSVNIQVKTNLISPIIDNQKDNNVRGLVSDRALLLQTLIDTLIIMRLNGKLNHESVVSVKNSFDLFVRGKELGDNILMRRGIVGLANENFAVDEAFITLYYPLTGGTKQ